MSVKYQANRCLLVISASKNSHFCYYNLFQVQLDFLSLFLLISGLFMYQTSNRSVFSAYNKNVDRICYPSNTCVERVKPKYISIFNKLLVANMTSFCFFIFSRILYHFRRAVFERAPPKRLGTQKSLPVQLHQIIHNQKPDTL